MDLFDSLIPDFHKPIRVIQSCKTLEQLESAKRYVKLFNLRYGIGGSSYINVVYKKCIFSKKMKLKNGWSNKG